jgi:REP element-mobilizing transposase RayT
MEFIGGRLYHIYNQGNNRQKIFFSAENYLFFLKKMRTHLLKHCELLSWCLMPNHFHWMVYIPEDYQKMVEEHEDKSQLLPMNKEISTLLSSYTKAINKSYGRSGSLFRKRTKAKCLNLPGVHDDFYPLVCFQYIHQNPLKTGLSKSLEGWPFSSFRDYEKSRTESICSLNLARELLDLPVNVDEFKDFSYQSINDEAVKHIF